MAQQAQFRSNLLLLGICLTMLGTGCKNRPVPSIRADRSDKNFSLVQDSLLYRGKPFTGYAYQLFDSGDTARLIPYVNGKMDGILRSWYQNKQREQQRYFVAGKKQGTHMGWWPNGNMKFEYHFVDDEHDGIAREWFSNGKPFRVFHYSRGHEEGSEKMWWDDGKIRANYVIVNGEKFGLFGQKICANKADNIIKNNK